MPKTSKITEILTRTFNKSYCKQEQLLFQLKVSLVKNIARHSDVPQGSVLESLVATDTVEKNIYPHSDNVIIVLI